MKTAAIFIPGFGMSRSSASQVGLYLPDWCITTAIIPDFYPYSYHSVSSLLSKVSGYDKLKVVLHSISAVLCLKLIRHPLIEYVFIEPTFLYRDWSSFLKGLRTIDPARRERLMRTAGRYLANVEEGRYICWSDYTTKSFGKFLDWSYKINDKEIMTRILESLPASTRYLYTEQEPPKWLCASSASKRLSRIHLGSHNPFITHPELFASLLTDSNEF